jgi:hypothetical protein
MIAFHSSTAQAAYTDLLRSLKDDAVAGTTGTLLKETRGARSYWYEAHRVGNEVKRRYIGEDSPELAERLASRRHLAASMKARAEHRTRLVRILRAEGSLPLDGATGALYNALARTGTFRLGGTIVGTHAFRLYEGELGIRISFDQMAQTDDLDIAQFERLSLALGDKVEDSMARTFEELDFLPQPSISGKAVWRWKQTKSDVQVEFLTPSFRDDEDIRPLPALGVSAQSLHFLNYLIAEPIKAAALYRSGVLVQIPRPERFAIHKLIVANRRLAGPDALKSRKDRAQAAYLITVLAEDRPDDLREAYKDALARGQSWRDHITASLKRMPETTATLAAL